MKMDLEFDNAMFAGIAIWLIVGAPMAKVMFGMFSKAGWPMPMLITVITLFMVFLLPICVFSAKKWMG